MARSCANSRSGIAEATRRRSNNDCDILIALDGRSTPAIIEELIDVTMFLVQYELFNMNIPSNNHEECDVTDVLGVHVVIIKGSYGAPRTSSASLILFF